jgi:L-ascorbate metabolism protein UlaG (beta-lactamase superfamily)
VRFSRGEFLQTGAVAGALVAAAGGDPVNASPVREKIKIRWFGGGVYELASMDDSAIVLVDAWLWNNTGWAAFGVTKPPELGSATAYAAHLKSRNPAAVLVALTHDHADHIGDYFELLPALVAAGLPVKTAGQSDLFRVALAPKFKAANLDPASLVVNKGAGINFGGTAEHNGIRAHLVPAVHSTFAGYPAAGFVLEIAGTRVYASGDTDLFGDMAAIGKRYQPHVAVLSTGNGAFTMGPQDAAAACALLGVSRAVPVHYAHNPLVLGTQCGEFFTAALAKASPSTIAVVLEPGGYAALA